MRLVNTLSLASALALVLSVPGATWAATDLPDQPPTIDQAQPPQAAPGEEPAPAVQDQAVPAPVAPPEGMVADQAEGQSLASELIGRPLVNSEGEAIGEVSDLIFDEEQGVTGVVFSVGGFLGLGSKPVGVPWDQVQLLELDGQQVIRVDLTEDQLAAAPNFRTRAQIEQQAADEAAAQKKLQNMQQDMQGSTAPPPE